MGTHAIRPSERVGRLLRQRRHELGWTLREVTERARAEAGERLPPSTLTRIEQGKLDPGTRRLHLLLRLYDIPPELVADLVEIESKASEPETDDLETLRREGERFWKAGDVPAALGHAIALRQRAPDTDEGRRLRQQGTLAFATQARNLGKLRLARRLLEDLLCEPPAPDLAIDALVLGASIWRGLGAPDVAVALVREAASRVKPRNVKQRAIVAHQEAKILLDAGRAAEAAKALSRAMAAYAKSGDSASIYNADRARVLRVEILRALGRPRKALAAATEALDAATEHGHALVALFARIEKGRLLVETGRPREGIETLRHALASAVFQSDRNAELHARHALWKAYEKTGDLESAGEEWRRARPLAESADDRSVEAAEVLAARSAAYLPTKTTTDLGPAS